VGLVLCGCSRSGTRCLFSTAPLDLFSSSPMATAGPAVGTAAIDPDVDCPEVSIRTGAATLLIGSKPGQEGEPNPLDVRYQGSITRTARECHVSGGVMTMKVGIEGRIITGPLGAPGAVDVPLRIAVVQEGPEPKTVASKFARETVTVQNTVDRVAFVHVEPDISFPLPQPASAIDRYVVYVGFDPIGAQPPAKKTPVRKRKPRSAPNPRSS
jgi:hypothetical protein